MDSSTTDAATSHRGMRGWLTPIAGLCVTAACTVAAARIYWMRTTGPIKPIFFFRPFPVINKTLLNQATTTSPPVWRLTFRLPPGQVLGINLALGEHVKVQLAETCVDNAKGGKPRSYSPTSDPQRKGSFDLTVKEYPGGCASQYLGGVSVGDNVYMSKGWPLPADWMMQRSPGKQIGLVAMGVGITEAVWVADAELRQSSDTIVKLLYANRYLADRIMSEELAKIKSEFPGRFSVQYLTSQESHPDAWHGRVSSQILANCFDWSNQDEARFLVVGTKPMKKDVYAMLDANGFPAKKHTLLLKQFTSRDGGGSSKQPTHSEQVGIPIIHNVHSSL